MACAEVRDMFLRGQHCLACRVHAAFSLETTLGSSITCFDVLSNTVIKCDTALFDDGSGDYWVGEPVGGGERLAAAAFALQRVGRDGRRLARSPTQDWATSQRSRTSSMPLSTGSSPGSRAARPRAPRPLPSPSSSSVCVCDSASIADSKSANRRFSSSWPAPRG